jgi:O-antigen/teichoic acid export membrane protein
VRAAFRIRLCTVAAGIAALAVVAWRKEGGLAAAALPLAAAFHLLPVAPNIAAASLQARVRYAAIGAAPLLGFLLYLLAAKALAANGVDDPGWFACAFALALMTQAALPWLLLRRGVAWFEPVAPGRIGALLEAMAPLGLSAALSTLYFRLDALLLNDLHGDIANGRWAKIFPLLSFGIALPSYLGAALFPALTRAAACGPGPLLLLVRRGASVLAAFALPLVAFAFLFGGQLLWLFWARRGGVEPLPQFVAGHGDLLRCLPLLALSATAIFLAIPQMQALTACGRQRSLLVVTAAALAVKWFAGRHLIREQGVIGAAWGTLLTEWFVLLAVSFEFRRAVGASFVGRGLLRPIGAAAGAAAVAWPLRELSPEAVAVVVPLLGAAAVAVGGALPLRFGVEE